MSHFALLILHLQLLFNVFLYIFLLVCHVPVLVDDPLGIWFLVIHLLSRLLLWIMLVVFIVLNVNKCWFAATRWAHHACVRALPLS